MRLLLLLLTLQGHAELRQKKRSQLGQLVGAMVLAKVVLWFVFTRAAEAQTETENGRQSVTLTFVMTNGPCSKEFGSA